jgi:hypothetical protein
MTHVLVCLHHRPETMMKAHKSSQDSCVYLSPVNFAAMSSMSVLTASSMPAVALLLSLSDAVSSIFWDTMLAWFC